MRINGERMRATRERKLLTQAELAEKAKVTESTVNRIENGLQSARISTVRKLAQALDVDPETLIVWDAAAEPEEETGKAAA